MSHEPWAIHNSYNVCRNRNSIKRFTFPFVRDSIEQRNGRISAKGKLIHFICALHLCRMERHVYDFIWLRQSLSLWNETTTPHHIAFRAGLHRLHDAAADGPKWIRFFFLLLQYICSVLATPTRWHKPRPAWWSHTRLNFYTKQISNYISKTTTKRIVVVVWVLSLSLYTICLYLPLLLLCIYSALMTFQPKRTVLFAEFHINFEWKRFGCTACL